MGTPELTGKFPGFLSPSENLKFADIPNGLGALSKVPFTGWVQMIAYAGVTEAKANYDEDVKNTPGDMGWKPPLLATEDPDTKTRRLNAELANGRLAMMAIIGMFFQDGLTGSAWGDWTAYTDSPLRAFESELGVQPPFGFWDPLGYASDGDVEVFKRRRAIEIKHGRVAMIAIIGMFYQDGLTGSAWGDWDLYTDSPLRAFEFELGSQAPLGFWDPLGLSADGDEQKFKRRREIEFKHGRVGMLATMGYIVPEYTKFPGYLPPSQDLKFADIPNGLAAISKVPTLGWVQILCFAGFIEGKGGLTWNNENPGDIGWKVITSSDPEMKAKKLAADLSN